MSLVTDLLPAIEAARSLAGSPDFGLHPFRVFIRAGSWDGTYTGDGTETQTETEITEAGQPPKVRTLNDEQLALGQAAKGSIRIGPITPSHSTGGTSLAALEASSLSVGQTFLVRLLHTGGSEAYYRVTDIDKDSALHYMMTCEPVS